MAFIAADNNNRGVLQTLSTGLREILDRECVAFQVGTVVTSPTWRLQVPRITGHTSAAWYSELEEIGATDIAIETDDVLLRKAAGRAVMSNEAWHSGVTDLLAVHGRDLKSQIISAVDSALFTAKTNPKAPAGLADDTEIQTFVLDAFDDLDAVYSAVSLINGGGQHFSADSVTMHPATLGRIRRMKESDTSRKGLVEVDPVAGVNVAGGTNVIGTLAGLELRTCRDMPVDDVWVTSRAGLLVARSGDPEVKVSEDAAFTIDGVMVRATIGVAFGVTSPETAVRITVPTEV